ncbi:MAG: hypothetical protein IJJ23_08630, partial [Clostridia bacterium]|nr:hypothetical protein [Clostridia bacterium]
MSKNTDKSPAYLRGLIEGLGIDVSSDTGRVLMAMLDVISAQSKRIDRLERRQTALQNELKEAETTLEDIDELCDLMMRDLIHLKDEGFDLSDDDEDDDLFEDDEERGFLRYRSGADDDDEDDEDDDDDE